MLQSNRTMSLLWCGVLLQVPVALASSAWSLELPAQPGGGAVQLLQELGILLGLCVPSVLVR